MVVGFGLLLIAFVCEVWVWLVIWWYGFDDIHDRPMKTKRSLSTMVDTKGLLPMGNTCMPALALHRHCHESHSDDGVTRRPLHLKKAFARGSLYSDS